MDPLLCSLKLDRDLNLPFPKRADLSFNMRDLGLYAVVFLNGAEQGLFLFGDGVKAREYGVESWFRATRFVEFTLFFFEPCLEFRKSGGINPCASTV